MELKTRNLIIGAGPAGIGTALALGEDYLLLEQRPDIGGLSGTVEFEGAVFDLGGHSFHTPHPEVRELVYASLEMFEQKRDARCFSHGDLIPYPFQKYFRQIKNQSVVEACAKGLEQISAGGPEPAHYEEFILKRFGAGISEHFMLPYNRKLWGRDLKRLSASWTGERVAAPEGVKEKFDTEGGARKPLQSDTHVAYPRKGGFGEIFKALAKNLKSVRCNSSVIKIDTIKKEVLTSDGTRIQFKNLVSTLPLQEVTTLIENTPDDIRGALRELECLSLKVVLVAINHPVDTGIQRVYSADPKIAAHKTAVNHNSSDYLRGLPHHGIMAEVSYSAEKPLWRTDVDRWVVENLKEMGLIKSFDEVRKTAVVDVKYAYPVPTLTRTSVVDRAKSWLEENSIYSVGRFGEWAYINSDEVLHRGMSLGNRLKKMS